MNYILRVPEGACKAEQPLASSFSVAAFYFIPVYHVPEAFDVVWATVLITEVVGVLPDVESEDGGVALHQR